MAHDMGSVNVIFEIMALTDALHVYIVFMVSLIEERMNIICSFAKFIACYLCGGSVPNKRLVNSATYICSISFKYLGPFAY